MTAIRKRANGAIEVINDAEQIVVNAGESVFAQATEAAAATVVPTWRANEAVSAGAVRSHGGKLYQVIQPHTTQANWSPNATPALWRRFYAPEDGPQPWVQPAGGHDAYKRGDRVTFEGSIYESTINANVWSPSAYPAGWTLIGPA